MVNWNLPSLSSRNFSEKFYTFIVPIENNQNNFAIFNWGIEKKLSQNFKFLQQNNEKVQKMCLDQNETYLFEYFLNIYQSQSTIKNQKLLAQWHLVAYLETPAFQAIRSLKFKSFENPQETWNYYFYLAKLLANDMSFILKIFKNYNKDLQSLQDYFQLTFFNKIRDIYYKETGEGKYSTWFLLKKTGKKELTKKLKELGISNSQIEPYLVARDCLFEVYSKSGQRWLCPNEINYKMATEFCQRHYFQIGLAKFKKLINMCIVALQYSFKVSYIGEDIETYLFESNKVDNISYLVPIESEVTTESISDYVIELNRVLLNELQLLKQETDNKVMLLLKYGLQLGEASIALKIGINQATVNRRCSRLRRQLLMSTAKWLKLRFSIDLIKLENLDDYIEKWLKDYYSNQIELVIQEAFKNSLNPDTREVLEAKYFYDVNHNQQIVKSKTSSKQEQTLMIDYAKKQLTTYLIDWLKTQNKLELCNNCDFKNIEKFIEKWLINDSKNSSINSTIKRSL
ncbi:hypothetical protein [Nostoc sp. PA-18-2419]|uniref:hypothetical protein n=1 Tax=Nostoc sp. PA-18-2419 TaxID=2575443 RepID=UPI001109427F|nr:hypothetical protein [Nostoc sp. PA-18-2419]